MPTFCAVARDPMFHSRCLLSCGLLKSTNALFWLQLFGVDGGAVLHLMKLDGDLSYSVES